MGYKKYIKGDYYQIRGMKKLTDGQQQTLDKLRERYPKGSTYKELAETYNLSEDSTNTNCQILSNRNVIFTKREVSKETKRDRQTYYFEDYNYISNEKKAFVHPFAPGYVQYDEDFLVNFGRLNVEFKAQIDDIYSLLMDILKNAVQHEKYSRSPQQCKICGYDHEMRDFMRATLLHLIDGIEGDDRFINFILNEGIVTEAIYERPKTELRRTPSKVSEQKETAHKELMKEQQSTLPEPGLEIKGNLWVQSLPRRGKLMVEHILSEKKHEMSNLQLMEMIEHRIKNRRVLDAIMEVGKDLAIRFPPEIYREVFRSIKQRDYENRPEIRKRRNKRRQEGKQAKLP